MHYITTQAVRPTNEEAEGPQGHPEEAQIHPFHETEKGVVYATISSRDERSHYQDSILEWLKSETTQRHANESSNDLQHAHFNSEAFRRAVRITWKKSHQA